MPNDERSRFASICLPKFGHQTLNCPSIRYIVPAKIFPALPLCQKNWFCSKVRLDDFYPLLRSIVSTWIHIGVKRIFQVCFLHHLKNMEKNVKYNFGMKNKIERFFWATLYNRYCKNTRCNLIKSHTHSSKYRNKNEKIYPPNSSSSVTIVAHLKVMDDSFTGMYLVALRRTFSMRYIFLE